MPNSKEMDPRIRGDDKVAEKIIKALIEKSNLTFRMLEIVKRRVSKEESEPLITSNRLLSCYRKLVAAQDIQSDKKIEGLFTVKRMRSESGVSIVTLLTMPFPCPGKCIYCPDEARMPKSYIASEPAATRALALNFDPYLQVARRIQMLEGNGHPTDKIELIIKGGTWSSYPIDYQQWFIYECFRAMNEVGTYERSFEKPNASYQFTRFWGETKQKWNVQLLFDEQKINETAPLHRCVGLTLETRPDCVNHQEVKRLRDLGCTRIELGVQTTDDAILSTARRGHTTEHVKIATRLLKNAGFKVDYHLMPGLPGSTPDNDLKSLKDLFANADYQPDMIKIYPTLVTPNTELEKWWKEGRYTPYSTDVLKELLAQMKACVPPYVRISRVIRDIPGQETVAGNKVTNLREAVQGYMKKNGMVCQCLRCREVKHRYFTTDVKSGIPLLTERTYEASGGKECFLSFEDIETKTVFAFLRMRFPSTNNGVEKHLPEITDAALIRELHTYGQLVPINESDTNASQHKGYGKQLLQRAEELAREAGFQKCAVISGVGVREYYRKRGYSLEGTYMVKHLQHVT